ncbi:uncharacterized protein LOC143237770 [Tachypleus tridentatus]|uniref:uncharacterized protein LOC143237770 n=1 Tax=Tachypleus tridentatus TaxID=6853 RepID=UPI003FD22415
MMATAACFSSLHELETLLQRCFNCCKGDCKSYHCPLCPASKFKPTKIVKVKSHLRVHWKTRVSGTNGLYSIICHLPHEGITSRHYHCPSCKKVIVKKSNLSNHINKNCKGYASPVIPERSATVIRLNSVGSSEKCLSNYVEFTDIL